MAEVAAQNTSGYMKCSLSVFSCKPCGPAASASCNNITVKLKDCKASVNSHLTRVGLVSGLREDLEADVTSEGQLISARVGIFLFDENLSVCPYHREVLGLRWYRPRTCLYPSHQGKQRPVKSCTLLMSRTLLYEEGTLVPVGGGICVTCYRNFIKKYKHDVFNVEPTETLNEYKENIDHGPLKRRQKEQLTVEPPYDANLNVSKEDIVCGPLKRRQKEQLTVELPYDANLDVSKEDIVCGPLKRRQKEQLTVEPPYDANLDVSKEDIVCGSLKRRQKEQLTVELPYDANLDVESLENSQSTCSAYSQESMDAKREKTGGLERVNRVLSLLSSDRMSPLRCQLKKDWDKTVDKTKRYYKRKADEGVDYLLEMIAPGQISQLKHKFQDKEDPKTKEFANLTLTIVKMIEETENNSLKIQLIGILTAQLSRNEILTLLPNLTSYQFYKALNINTTSAGMSLSSKEHVTRQKMDQNKLQHALSFFMDPSFTQSVSYGTRQLKLESGDILTIPDVVRTVCHSQMIDLYSSYCKETDFDPLGKSTLFKILNSCAAAKRTNLQGLDNIAADGNEAFKSINERLDIMLAKNEITKEKEQKIKEGLLKLRHHLKSTYKFHCDFQDSCSDHCIQWLLSDPNREEFRTECDHIHSSTCPQCNIIRSVSKEIPDFQQMESIYDWKRHIVRTINQDKSRLNILKRLENNQVLLIMDWAMKFLPSKYREKQSDWFGQRGKNWHVSVAIFKAPTGELCHRTYTHIFESVKQDWFCVASILEHTLKTIHDQLPNIGEAYIRSDNAGCYHCAPLWLTIPGISERTGIWICNICYSEAQSGKSYCDAKIAHMRTKMKTYVATGKDIISAMDMKAAIDYGKGVGGCQVCVGSIDVSKQTLFGHKMKEVSKYTDIQFEGGSMKFRKAYGIGQGMVLSENYLKSLSAAQDETGFVMIANFSCPIKQEGHISSEKKPRNVKSENNNFLCTEDGCTVTLESYQALVNHITLGIHSVEHQKESSFDKVKRQWAKHCNEIGIKDQVHFHTDQIDTHEDLSETAGHPQGWALKVTKARPRFPQHVRDFLQNKFMEGEKSGRKVTPQDVEREMKCQVSESGQPVFTEKECLSVSQITSFFSRLGNLSNKSFEKVNSKSDDELICCLAQIEENDVLDSIQK